MLQGENVWGMLTAFVDLVQHVMGVKRYDQRIWLSSLLSRLRSAISRLKQRRLACTMRSGISISSSYPDRLPNHVRSTVYAAFLQQKCCGSCRWFVLFRPNISLNAVAGIRAF